ncbi:hypothetical protein, partial [Caballeronia ptereochthonis]|uniref:hypothetical protein n=1 Tax=Caballeronia ptereochthonis TaxID=1777144 RepID=UPI001ABFA76A
LAAHIDLLGCHKLWLEDVYERLAGPSCFMPSAGTIQPIAERIALKARPRERGELSPFMTMSAVTAMKPLNIRSPYGGGRPLADVGRSPRRR